jgi:hypothetical protein
VSYLLVILGHRLGTTRFRVCCSHSLAFFFKLNTKTHVSAESPQKKVSTCVCQLSETTYCNYQKLLGLVWLHRNLGGSPCFPWAKQPRAELPRGSLPRHLVAAGPMYPGLFMAFPRETFPPVRRSGRNSSSCCLSRTTRTRRRWEPRSRSPSSGKESEALSKALCLRPSASGISSASIRASPPATVPSPRSAGRRSPASPRSTGRRCPASLLSGLSPV